MAGEVLAAEHVPTWRLHRLFDKAGAPRCAAKPPPVRGLPPRPRRAGAASRAVPFAGAHRHTARRSHAGRQPRCPSLSCCRRPLRRPPPPRSYLPTWRPRRRCAGCRRGHAAQAQPYWLCSSLAHAFTQLGAHLRTDGIDAAFLHTRAAALRTAFRPALGGSATRAWSPPAPTDKLSRRPYHASRRVGGT